jgi:hypothetical protein
LGEFASNLTKDGIETIKFIYYAAMIFAFYSSTVTTLWHNPAGNMTNNMINNILNPTNETEKAIISKIEQHFAAKQKPPLNTEVQKNKFTVKNDNNIDADGYTYNLGTKSIIFHPKDVKFLAVKLSTYYTEQPPPSDTLPKKVGILNPSDAIAVVLGLIGYYWEHGYGDGYVGEEDMIATSTHILANIAVIRKSELSGKMIPYSHIGQL